MRPQSSEAARPPRNADPARTSAFAGMMLPPQPQSGPPRPRPRQNKPWTEPEHVVVDGRNVQRALERGAALGAMPTASLVAKLRAAFPPPTQVELVLDGHRAGGPGGKVAPGFSVTFSRERTADAVIADRTFDALRELGPAEAWSVLVISDDREVQDQARRNGCRAEGTVWLMDRWARAGAAPALGNRPAR